MADSHIERNVFLLLAAGTALLLGTSCKDNKGTNTARTQKDENNITQRVETNNYAFPAGQTNLAFAEITRQERFNQPFITWNGKDYSVETNRYPVGKELSFMLRGLENATLHGLPADQLGTLDAPLYIFTPATNQAGKFVKGWNFDTNGPAAIRNTRAYTSVTNAQGDGLGKTITVTLNRPLNTWNVGGRAFYLPRDNEATTNTLPFAIVRADEGKRTYLPNGTVQQTRYASDEPIVFKGTLLSEGEYLKRGQNIPSTNAPAGLSGRVVE